QDAEHAGAGGMDPNMLLTGGSGGRSNGSGGTATINSCDVSMSDAACVGEQYEGKVIPLDIYIMFDQSGSMCSNLQGDQIACDATVCGDTAVKATSQISRIDAVRTAAAAFLNDPESAGIGVGIGYFGYQCIGETSCNPDDYAVPKVPIGVLPANAGAILGSLDA